MSLPHFSDFTDNYTKPKMGEVIYKHVKIEDNTH